MVDTIEVWLDALAFIVIYVAIASPCYGAVMYGDPWNWWRKQHG